ncbi:MAG: phosphate regulon sensor histidine kinase PhoR [bacterium]
MTPSFYMELLLVAALVAVSVILGMLSGHTAWWLVVMLGLYIVWMLFNGLRVLRWLKKPTREIPYSSGIWDDIFFRLNEEHKRGRKSRKRLGKMLSRFQKSTQALPYATVVLNNLDEIEWYNPAARTLLGLRSSKGAGKCITNILDDKKFTRYLESRNFDKPLELELGQLTLVFSLTPFGEGQYLMTARDVTERQRLDNMRRDFIANASHELRTPLTVISGYLEVVGLRLPDEFQEPIVKMQQQASRMHIIIEDLMVLSKLETEAFPDMSKTVDLASLVEEVYSDAIDLDRGAHQITTQINPAEVPGERQELYMALNNLVTNAIRYTSAGGTIKITLGKKNGVTFLSVKDNGNGISAEHLPRLTERFFRVDPGQSRESGGTGLGLAIVKHALERHQATLEIESTPGKGSEFRCVFSGVTR